MSTPQSESPQGDRPDSHSNPVDLSAGPSDSLPKRSAKPKTNPREDRYECRSCGYAYEPLKGDDRRNVPANTAFTELDAQWLCPVCRSPKNQFDNIGPKGKASGFEENLGYGLGVNVLTPGQKNVLIFGALGLAFLFFISLYGLG